MPLILLNKPYRVLCQFRDQRGRPTLADFVSTPRVYAAGRLDYDSEGLVMLTDDGRLQARISEARHKLDKHYWVQVEGEADHLQLQALERGVRLKDGVASALGARRIDEPAQIWPRNPPIRQRRHLVTSWLEIGIDEGRNRQVRRMTAAVGLPTLRLIRHRAGLWILGGLAPGESTLTANETAWKKLQRYAAGPLD